MSKNNEKWIFKLERDFTWKTPFKITENLDFKDKTKVTRLKLSKPNRLTVTKDYAWDGCTPKFFLLDIYVGTPDGVIDSKTQKPKTYYDSLVHDVLYQFLGADLPASRYQADHSFLMLMGETGFSLKWIYWLAVRIFGWLFVLDHRYKRKNRGIKLLARS